LTLVEDGKALTFQISGGRVELCQPTPRRNHAKQNSARASRNGALHREGGSKA
jgi:hypothetical protein